MTKQTVEMHPAYVWDCENCGGENFERAIVYEFTPEEAREMIAEGEEPPTGNWMTHPTEVKCPHCGAEYDARHFRQNEVEE